MTGPLFLAENGLGRTIVSNYWTESVLAFSTFLKCNGPIISNLLIFSVHGQSARGCERLSL